MKRIYVKEEVCMGCHLCEVYTSDATQHNTPVWVERFQKEFNPKGLSNAGFPYIGDKLSPIFPDMITDEIREAVKGVKEGRWRGL